MIALEIGEIVFIASNVLLLYFKTCRLVRLVSYRVVKITKSVIMFVLFRSSRH